MMLGGGSSAPRDQLRCRPCRKVEPLRRDPRKEVSEYSEAYARRIGLLPAIARDPRPCVRCGDTFEPYRPNNIYCRRRCQWAARKTADRGYGAIHQRLRAWWADHVSAGRAYCTQPVCVQPDRWIDPDSEWDLGHVEDRTDWLGPTHRACNRHNEFDGEQVDGFGGKLDLAPPVSVFEGRKASERRRNCPVCGTWMHKGRCWSCEPSRKVRTRSHGELVSLGQRAAEMRTGGRKWQDIDDELGIGNTGNTYRLAVEYGGFVPCRVIARSQPRKQG